MNYKELITEISSRTGMMQKDADACATALVEVMKDAFASADSVAFQGFGVFEVKKKESRMMKNPQTQQQMLVPPRMVLEFKPSATLKDKLKEIPASE